METDDEYVQRRFREAIPKGLTQSAPIPEPPRQHVLGTVGEGRDKLIPQQIPEQAIVNGQVGDGANNGSLNLIVVIDGVGYNALFNATLGSPI